MIALTFIGKTIYVEKPSAVLRRQYWKDRLLHFLLCTWARPISLPTLHVDAYTVPRSFVLFAQIICDICLRDICLYTSTIAVNGIASVELSALRNYILKFISHICLQKRFSQPVWVCNPKTSLSFFFIKMTLYLINSAYENWWQCVSWIAQSNSDTDFDKRITAGFFLMKLSVLWAPQIKNELY